MNFLLWMAGILVYLYTGLSIFSSVLSVVKGQDVKITASIGTLIVFMVLWPVLLMYAAISATIQVVTRRV